MQPTETTQDFTAYQEIMKKGSKTFSMAARLFDRKCRFGAMLLYSWCRYCDDAIDAAIAQEAALDALDHLKVQTERALDFTTPAPTELAFRALRDICQTYEIPALYPIELLNGMEMDTAGIRIRTEADLKLYCYRVAAVVGLMMTHIMGVTDPRALRHAVDTGLAMQMTNIARDIADDYNMKRIYIPDSWFVETGLTRPRFEDRQLFVPQVFTGLTKRLVALADTYYASGRSGIRYLPWRAAFAGASAQRIYREIGIRVVAQSDQAWFSRTYVPFARKLVLMTYAVADVLVIKGRVALAGLFAGSELKTRELRELLTETSPTHYQVTTASTDQAPAESDSGSAPDVKSGRDLEFRDGLFRANDL